MTLDEFQKAALRTAQGMEPRSQTEALSDWGLGLASEAGEVAGLLKKGLYRGHPFDKAKVLEELGDCLWYIAAMSNQVGESLQSVASAVIQKLKKRYPVGFNSSDSIARIDTQVKP